jgi:hypothetical protein
MTMAVMASAQDEPKSYLANKVVDYSVSRTLPFETPGQMTFENVIVDDKRFAMLMQWKNVKFEPVALLELATVRIPRVAPGAIQIDGDDSDWGGILPAVVDPAGDIRSVYAGTTGTDMANVYLARCGTYVYVRMTLHNGGPIEDTLYFVELQQYLLQLHTPGDIMTVCSKQAGDPGWSVGVSDRNGLQIANYGPGAGYGAAGAGFVEWKIPIAKLKNPPATPLPYYPAAPPDRGIENRFIRAYIHPGPHPTPNPPSDENEGLARPLIIDFYPPPPQ